MVDGHLRLRGARGIFALGDTATIEQAWGPSNSLTCCLEGA